MRLGYPGIRLPSVQNPEADRRAAELVEHLKLPGIPIPLRDGREHHLYKIHGPEKEQILKFPRSDALPDPFDINRSASERLAGESRAIALVKNIPVPRPYCFHPELTCSVMAMLPGVSPESHLEKKRLDWVGLMGLCVQMGRMLAHVHLMKRPSDGGGLPDLPDADPAHSRLLHLDFHIGNVLGHPALGWQLTGVVDWTCARWGPPEADLVEMQVSVFVANPDARSAFLMGYRQTSGIVLDVKEVERRAEKEIRRRLVADPPEGEMVHLWHQWLERR